MERNRPRPQLTLSLPQLSLFNEDGQEQIIEDEDFLGKATSHKP
jgi:hypothetical protein